GNFVADGLVLPDRSPSPALLDAKHHYSPVGLEASPGTVRITNRYAFSDLSHLRAEVSLDSQASWQELELPAIAPGGSAEVALPVHEGAATTVRLTTREAQGPVPAGHLIVSADHVDAERLRAAHTPSAAAHLAPTRAEDGTWSLGPARAGDRARGCGPVPRAGGQRARPHPRPAGGALEADRAGPRPAPPGRDRRRRGPPGRAQPARPGRLRARRRRPRAVERRRPG